LGVVKLEPCGNHLDENVDNLVDLDELSEGAILHHVRNRFLRKVTDCFIYIIIIQFLYYCFLYYCMHITSVGDLYTCGFHFGGSKSFREA